MVENLDDKVINVVQLLVQSDGETYSTAAVKILLLR